MAPLTSGRVTISVAAIYSAKVVTCLWITFHLSILLDLELHITPLDFIDVPFTHKYHITLLPGWFSNCYKILINKESLLTYTKWA